MPPSQSSIVVQIDRVLHFNTETRWGIFKTNPCGGESAGGAIRGLVCKGCVPFDVKEGDRLKLEGYFKVSDYSGQNEFSFRACIPNLPTDLAALLHYAVSITKGLGETREAMIWARYGESWITQERLDIDGVPERVQFAWADTLRKLSESQAQAQAISFLMSRGCTLNMATVAWNEWKENTIGTVNADFYQLAQLPHYGFKAVDEKIRPHFDIKDDDPRRLKAAIVYVVGELCNSGDTLVKLATARESVKALVPHLNEAFDACVKELEARGDLVLLDEANVALGSDAGNEREIFERFQR